MSAHDAGAITAPQAPRTALVELGQALFFDAELSGNRDISCATCHHPAHGTGDGLPVSIGTGGKGLGPDRELGHDRSFIPRNAPEIFNRGHGDWHTMFWDNRVASDYGAILLTPAGAALPAGLDGALAAQAMFPVTSADEMLGEVGDVGATGEPNELAPLGGHLPTLWKALTARLVAIDEYVALFEAAYPDVAPEDLGFRHAANAIAAFEIDAFSFEHSPWDRYLRGQEEALSEAQKRGALLFYGDAGCAACHSGVLMTDQKTHNICAPQLGPGKGEESPLDLGRWRETQRDEDRYAFRTPPLRNVELTGPWMHDGAYATLEAVIRHHMDPIAATMGYDMDQVRADLRDSVLQDEGILAEMAAGIDALLAPAGALSDEDVADLVAFMEALTDPAARDLGHLVPERVPSGLDVDR